MRPTKKSPQLKQIIDSLNPSGRKRTSSIQQGICAWCGKPVTEFKDSLSYREYTISGLCQACQDKVFGG